MNDMSSVIVARSDQINAEDLVAGPKTITITGVAIKLGAEQPVAINFEGSDKVWRPCKTTSRILVAAWGVDAKAYVGRAVTLYRDPKVKWGGIEVGGIRISHLSGIDKDMTIALAETRQARKAHVIKPLRDAPSAAQGRPAANNGRVVGERSAVPLADHVEAAKDALVKASAEGPDVVEARWTGQKMTALRERLSAPEHAELLADLQGVYESARGDTETSADDDLDFTSDTLSMVDRILADIHPMTSAHQANDYARKMEAAINALGGEEKARVLAALKEKRSGR